MTDKLQETLDYVKESGVKLVQLAFCDISGAPKIISVMPDSLKKAFSGGIQADSTALKGFSPVNSDVMLIPDQSTLCFLPDGYERAARFYCGVRLPDKQFFGDSREILKSAVTRAEKEGFVLKISAEIQFYLFKTDINGIPFDETYDQGGYLDTAPLDKSGNIRREICLNLEKTGIIPESAHHEKGPGQNEIEFTGSDILTAADNFFTCKSVIKEAAANNGLFASFMPKPVKSENGNSIHLKLSLYKKGRNLFAGETAGESGHFIAGIIEKAAEMSVFFNPVINSYDRLGDGRAPKYVSWSGRSHSHLMRRSAVSDCFELRSPDSALNPYVSFALLLHAGLDGIKNKTPLPPPCDTDLNTAPVSITDKLKKLPDSLDAAVRLAEDSGFLKEHLDNEFLTQYIGLLKTDLSDFEKSRDEDDFVRKNYFLKI